MHLSFPPGYYLGVHSPLHTVQLKCILSLIIALYNTRNVFEEKSVQVLPHIPIPSLRRIVCKYLCRLCVSCSLNAAFFEQRLLLYDDPHSCGMHGNANQWDISHIMYIHPKSQQSEEKLYDRRNNASIVYWTLSELQALPLLPNRSYSLQKSQKSSFPLLLVGRSLQPKHMRMQTPIASTSIHQHIYQRLGCVQTN